MFLICGCFGEINDETMIMDYGPAHLDNNNNIIQDNVYGAVIMAEPLREFTWFI